MPVDGHRSTPQLFSHLSSCAFFSTNMGNSHHSRYAQYLVSVCGCDELVECRATSLSQRTGVCHAHHGRPGAQQLWRPDFPQAARYHNAWFCCSHDALGHDACWVVRFKWPAVRHGASLCRQCRRAVHACRYFQFGWRGPAARSIDSIPNCDRMHVTQDVWLRMHAHVV